MSSLMIGTDYRLTADDLQWVLERRTEAKKADAKNPYTWHLVGYYPRLEQAFDSLLEYKLKAADMAEFKSLIWLLGETRKEIREAIRGMREIVGG